MFRRLALLTPADGKRTVAERCHKAHQQQKKRGAHFLLKIIPHVDSRPHICEFVEYYLDDVTVKGAWTGPASLSLDPHAPALVAELPVLDVISAVHIVADLTLGLGKVVHDYLD